VFGGDHQPFSEFNRTDQQHSADDENDEPNSDLLPILFATSAPLKANPANAMG
jgi:hypothetical protein